MRRLALALALLLGAGPGLACTVPAEAASLRAQLLAAVNADRARHGRAALSASPQLERLAQDLACDNARRGRLSHTTADGRGLAARIAGYAHRGVNENIAQGPATPQGAVDLWRQSPPHRRNLRARAMRDFGGGVARGADGGYYWAMISARPG